MKITLKICCFFSFSQLLWDNCLNLNICIEMNGNQQPDAIREYRNTFYSNSKHLKEKAMKIIFMFK